MGGKRLCFILLMLVILMANVGDCKKNRVQKTLDKLKKLVKQKTTTTHKPYVYHSKYNKTVAHHTQNAPMRQNSTIMKYHQTNMYQAPPTPQVILVQNQKKDKDSSYLSGLLAGVAIKNGLEHKKQQQKSAKTIFNPVPIKPFHSPLAPLGQHLYGQVQNTYNPPINPNQNQNAYYPHGNNPTAGNTGWTANTQNTFGHGGSGQYHNQIQQTHVSTVNSAPPQNPAWSASGQNTFGQTQYGQQQYQQQNVGTVNQPVWTGTDQNTVGQSGHYGQYQNQQLNMGVANNQAGNANWGASGHNTYGQTQYGQYQSGYNATTQNHRANFTQTNANWASPSNYPVQHTSTYQTSTQYRKNGASVLSFHYSGLGLMTLVTLLFSFNLY